MEKRTMKLIPQILIGLLILSLITMSCILILNYMGEKIMSDCKKQDNQGIIKYWDADIDCSKMTYSHTLKGRVS